MRLGQQAGGVDDEDRHRDAVLGAAITEVPVENWLAAEPSRKDEMPGLRTRIST